MFFPYFVNSWQNLKNSNKEKRRPEPRCPLSQAEKEMPPETRMTPVPAAEQKEMCPQKESLSSSKAGLRFGFSSVMLGPLPVSLKQHMQRVALEVLKGEILSSCWWHTRMLGWVKTSSQLRAWVELRVWPRQDCFHVDSGNLKAWSDNTAVT